MIDKLITKIKATDAPIVVGLDPMLSYIPNHIKEAAFKEFGETLEGAAEAAWQYNKGIVDAIYDIVPAVKPQVAMYEQFGIPGLVAFKKTVDYCKSKGLHTQNHWLIAQHDDIFWRKSYDTRIYFNLLCGEAMKQIEPGYVKIKIPSTQKSVAMNAILINQIYYMLFPKEIPQYRYVRGAEEHCRIPLYLTLYDGHGSQVLPNGF